MTNLVYMYTHTFMTMYMPEYGQRTYRQKKSGNICMIDIYTLI